jgi:NAD(P)-dependent dehydrogenase (short-subunit alcohol dehydrogenase family)
LDINAEAGESFVSELNQSRPNSAHFAKCDVSNWDDLTSAFAKALNTFDRIDYVFPVAGITERQVVPKPSEQKDVRKEGFVKPDLTVIDVNLNAMINLILIAIQAFRGQEVRQELGGMRGKSEHLVYLRDRCLTNVNQSFVLRALVGCMRWQVYRYIQHLNSKSFRIRSYHTSNASYRPAVW